MREWMRRADRNKMNNIWIYYCPMKLSSFLLAAFLSAQACTLHLQEHQSVSSYLSYLQTQQRGVTDDLQTIHSDIIDTRSKVQSESDIDKKIRLLEEAILRQKVSLSSASKALIAPLNESSWVCQNLQGTTDEELRSLAGDIVTSTANLDENIRKLDSEGVSGSEELEQDSGMAKTYGEQIQKALKSPGTYVNSIPTSYHTDLSVPNWISGGLTPEQINQQIDDLQGNVIACPKANPFFNGFACISCNDQNPFFNLATKECTKCDSFNANLHTCQSNYDGLNTDAGRDRLILPPGLTIDDVIKEQGDNLCSAERPFFANGNCLNCNSPNTLFDYKLKKCVSCPQGDIYEAEKFSCVSSSVTVTNLATGKDTMILPSGKTIEKLQEEINILAQTSDIKECPKEKPFFNTKQCIDCPDQYFSVEENKCIKCTDGKVFDLFTHSCQTVSYYSNLGADSWSSTNPDQIRNQVAEAAKVQGAKQCPIQKPFFNGKQCANCPEKGSFFSFDGMKCSTCSSDSIFNYNMHSCVQPNNNYQTNVLKAPSLIYGGKSKNEWETIYYQNIEKNPSIADCPTATPYFDGILCVKCPSDAPYFNMEYRKCQVCEQGSKYDSSIHQCLSDEGNIVRQAPNIEKMAASIFA